MRFALQTKPPKDLLIRHFADVAGDTPFRGWCRLKQSLYRQKHGWECGTVGERGLTGNYLTEKDAATGVNFLDWAIFESAKDRLVHREPNDVIEPARLYRNLLTSQTMCFNLFLPQAKSLDLATQIWQQVLPDKVVKVTAVKLEHSPGRGQSNVGTGDHSAFDAFIEYDHRDGSNGFLAIETKYTESFSADGSDPTARQKNLANTTGLYTPVSFQTLQSMPTQQIWRTHLLAETMRGERFRHVTYIVLHAAGDRECSDMVPMYKESLSHHGRVEDRFLCMTLENLLQVANEVVVGVYRAWLDAFFSRYLDWAPVEQALDAMKSRS